MKGMGQYQLIKIIVYQAGRQVKHRSKPLHNHIMVVIIITKLNTIRTKIYPEVQRIKPILCSIMSSTFLQKIILLRKTFMFHNRLTSNSVKCKKAWVLLMLELRIGKLRRLSKLG